MGSVEIVMRLVVPDTEVTRTFAVCEDSDIETLGHLVCIAFGWQHYWWKMTADGLNVLPTKAKMIWDLVPRMPVQISDAETVSDLIGKEVLVRPDDRTDVAVEVWIGGECDVPCGQCPKLLGFSGGVPDLSGRIRYKPMKTGTDMLSNRSLSRRLANLKREEVMPLPTPDVVPTGTLSVRIVLMNVEPEVSRTVAVPSWIDFADLHLIIQTAMGWTDSHLHSYSVRGAKTIIEDIPEDEDRPFGFRILSEDTRIAGFVGVPMTYTYDFGDEWDHDIMTEMVEGDGGERVLTDWRGICPPEDCGGPWGYRDLVRILGDPRDPRHDDLKGWAEMMGYGSWDPEVAEKRLKRLLSDMARRQSTEHLTTRW